MNPNEYQRRAMGKEANQLTIHYYVASQDADVGTRFTNGLVGLTDEVGELASLRKRWLEYQGNSPTEEEILEECGDVLWRTAQILTAFGLMLEQAMRANLDKLENVRYRDTACNPYDAAEENRDREAEADAMGRALLASELQEEATVIPEAFKAEWALEQKKKLTAVTEYLTEQIDVMNKEKRKAQAEDDGVRYPEAY